MFKITGKREMKIRLKKDRVEPKLLGDKAILNLFKEERVYRATRLAYKSEESGELMFIYNIYPIANSPVGGFIDCNEEEFNMYFEEVVGGVE